MSILSLMLEDAVAAKSRDIDLEQLGGEASLMLEYLSNILRPIQLINNLRVAVRHNNHLEAYSIRGAILESFNGLPQLTTESLIGLNKYHLNHEGNASFQSDMESFAAAVIDKIKAFFKWCYDKIASVGNMIKGWFNSDENTKLEKRIKENMVEIARGINIKIKPYTVNGIKRLKSSAELAESAQKVADMFKHYLDCISKINDKLSKITTDSKEWLNNKQLSSDLRSTILDFSISGTFLGFEFSGIKEELSTDSNEPAPNKVKFISATVPDGEDHYEIDISKSDLTTSLGHFNNAEGYAKDFTAHLEKLMSTLKIIESELDKQSNDNTGNELYSTMRTALGISGELISNIAKAAKQLAAAKEYWCSTVVQEMEKSDTTSAPRSSPESSNKKENTDTKLH